MRRVRHLRRDASGESVFGSHEVSDVSSRGDACVLLAERAVDVAAETDGRRNEREEQLCAAPVQNRMRMRKAEEDAGARSARVGKTRRPDATRLERSSALGRRTLTSRRRRCRRAAMTSGMHRQTIARRDDVQKPSTLSIVANNASSSACTAVTASPAFSRSSTTAADADSAGKPYEPPAPRTW